MLDITRAFEAWRCQMLNSGTAMRLFRKGRINCGLTAALVSAVATERSCSVKGCSEEVSLGFYGFHLLHH